MAILLYEDGLQFAGVIPNDKQIVGYAEVAIYQAEDPTKERAEISLEEVPGGLEAVHMGQR